MKSSLIAVLALLAGFASAQPVIQQISPGSATTSAQVTIAGSGFNGIADSNVVYFGPVRAQALNASASVLSVVVPLGATYDYVTVTTQQLTAFSKTRFLPAADLRDSVRANALQSRQDFNSGNFTFTMALADFDGNGFTDIVTGSNTANIVRILKNTSSANSLILQPLDLTLSSGGSQVAVGDVNGDGKPDILVSLNGIATITAFLNNSTPGNFSFLPGISINSTLVQAGLAIDDIDRDGKPDIIAANQFNNTVSILKNTGSGAQISFAAPVSFSTGQYPARIKIDDFNGDGIHDIAVINFSSNNISILENNSSPGILQLSPKIDFATPGSPGTLAVGDLNADGKSDMVVGMGSGNSFSIFQNSSVGSINFNRKDIVWGIGPGAVGIDDLNGDAKPDLVVAGGDNFLSVYQNKSTPDSSISFSSPVKVIVNNSSNLLSVADLNNTGHPEIILGCPDRISIHINKPFQPIVHYFSPTSGSVDSVITIHGKYFTSVTSVVFGQIDAKSFVILNDSVIKATLDVGYTGNVYVYYASGLTTSDSIFTYVRNPPVIQSVLPTAAGAGTIVTLKGRNFDPAPEKNVVKFGAGLAKVISASDSQLMVAVPRSATYDHISVTRNSTTGYSAVMFNPIFSGSKGVFTKDLFAPALDSITGAGPTSLALGDFNQDGRTDVAVLNTTAGRLSIYRTNADSGSVGFEAATLRSLAAGVQGISASDISGYGRVEFAVGRTGAGGWYWIRNPFIPGVYNTYSAISFNYASKPFAIRCADLEGNGTPDVVGLSKGSGGSGKLQIVKNESAGSFGYVPVGEVLSADNYPTDFIIEDFDADGKPDIIVSDSLSGLSLFRNTSVDAGISFSNRSFLTGNTNIQSIAAVDFDKDGKLDIAAAGLDNNVRIFRNVSSLGNISFSVFEADIASKGYRLSIADIDGDGSPDVCSFNQLSNEIMLLRNAGQFPVLFNSFYPFPTAKGVSDVRFADLDGNGKPEMITANFTSNSFSVYKNQVGETVNFALCAGQGGALTGDVTGSGYQWQLDMGSGYQNITDANSYDGFNSNTLIFKTSAGSWYGYKYRLLADGTSSSEYLLKFQNQWTGNANNSWENAANWSCGSVPDANTDVIINTGTIIINSAAIVRGLKIKPGVQVTVSSGASLTLTH